MLPKSVNFYCISVVSLLLSSTPLIGAINWNVTFNDVVNSTGIGFDDPTYGAQRQSTFIATLTYINSVLDQNGTVDFVVQNSLNDGSSGTLASAGTYYFTGPNGFSNGLLFSHATTGVDPTGSVHDANAEFNFGYNWNSGLGASANNEFDLFTVSLHEISHAMGFASLLTPSGTSAISGGDPGVFSVFDSYLERGDGTDLFEAGGNYLGDASDLTSNDVYFNGANAVAANGGETVQVYSPPTFNEGSSISHLNDPEKVMYYAVAPGQEKRAYSGIELAILQDLGWDLTAEGLSAVPEPNAIYLSFCVTMALAFRRRRASM